MRDGTFTCRSRGLALRQVIDEAGEIVEGKWLCEGIALQIVAAELAQNTSMFVRLHAFRHSLDSERTGDLDDIAHQTAFLRLYRDGKYQLAVDL